jgi:hypothetical protein
MTSTPAPKVEYDGYYLIDVVARGGFCLTIPARGYSLKSWLNFEKSLGSAVEYRAVSEQEWTRLHWTQTPYEEDSAGFAILARKAAKKTAEKAVKKATKKAVKKAVKKPHTRNRRPKRKQLNQKPPQGGFFVLYYYGSDRV